MDGLAASGYNARLAAGRSDGGAVEVATKFLD